MEVCTGVICPECPYKLDAAKNYFGGNEKSNYEDPITRDIPTACHLTIGTAKPCYCSGLAATRVNSCKRARGSQGVVAASENKIRPKTEERKKVFKNSIEFNRHHNLNINL